MNYTWDEIEHLTGILEAEAEGRPVDAERALALAERLSEIYPDMGKSMAQVVARMRAAKASSG